MVLLPNSEASKPKNEKRLYARNGWEIPCEVLHSDEILPPRKMTINAVELQRWHRNLKLRSLSNYPYNCVGMIFAARRAWIEITHIEELLAADGYRSIPRADVQEGDIILYRNLRQQPTHVALIIGVVKYGSTLDLRVISKWGKDAEFIHSAEDVAEALGKPASYYTERVE